MGIIQKPCSFLYVLSRFSHVRLFETLWTVACPWGFSRKEYWSGLPCPPPGDLTDPEIEPSSLTSPALAGGFFITSATLKWSENHSATSDSLWPYGLYSPWNSPGQSTGVGSLFLLQGIFPTQGSNLGLLHSGRLVTSWATREALQIVNLNHSKHLFWPQCSKIRSQLQEKNY